VNALQGIKYRESLREWAELEERRLAQGTPGKRSGSEAGEDVGVLKREVEMLRESRQKELTAAKENFDRELRRSEADVRVLKEEYQKLLKTKNEMEATMKQEVKDLRENNEQLRQTASRLEDTAKKGVAQASELTSRSEALKQEAASARRENQALQETVQKLQAAAEKEKARASAHSSAVMQKLEDENETLRRENEILLNAHHESKHAYALLSVANEEGRESVSALQRKILDLEEAVRQGEVAALNTVSADEASMLKMQIDLLKRENDELLKRESSLKKENEMLRAQQDGRRDIPDRSSLDSISGLDETDSEMNSLDVTSHPHRGDNRSGMNDLCDSERFDLFCRGEPQASATARKSSCQVAPSEARLNRRYFSSLPCSPKACL